ncbi:MAG: hypothetical protein H8F28_02935, partial [Fibrella sp.]|nr:hypothetical protein [Armatimonadota bacterium]
ETGWADEARSLTDTLLETFWDATDGGFFYSGTGHETLIAQSKDFFDGALPSPNGVAARVLARLAKLPNGGRYERFIHVMLSNYHGLMARAPQATATLILAAREMLGDSQAPPVREAVLLSANTGEFTLKPGETTTATFTFIIADGFHVNARFVPRPDLIATVAMIGTSAPAAIGPIRFPAETMYDDGTGEHLPIYQGETQFHLPIVVAEDASAGTYSLTLMVRTQPCTDTEGLAPIERTATARIIVTPV